MATLTRHFTWLKHDDTGFIGWVPTACKDDPLFMPSEGFGMAHDTLEHFSMDGTMEDECLAFGSLYYIRAEQGRIQNYRSMNGYTPAHTFARDLADMFRDNLYADLKPGGRVLPSHHTQEMFDIRAEMKGHFFSDVEGNDRERFDAEFNDDVEEFRAYMGEWFETAFVWMVKGYRKAMRRWDSHGHNHSLRSCYPAAEACDLFWNLAEELDRNWTKDEEAFVPGDQLAIHVNCKRRSFNIVAKRQQQY